MYENFKIPSGVSVAGYRWECEKPHHIVGLIHGIGEYQGRYDRMANFLNEKGIAVMGMDLRGHGLSEGVRGHAAPRDGLLADIDSFLSCIKRDYPDLPIVLYGHSMGGNITLDYRIRGRNAGIPDAYIISAPWVRLCHPIPKTLQKVARQMARIRPEFQFTSKIDETLLGNSKYVGQYYKNPLIHGKITALCASECLTIADKLYENTVEGSGAGRGKPLLLMHGDSDRICAMEGSRRIAQYEENCTYIEWPGYFHEIHNGGAEATGEDVLRTVAQFVNGI